MSSPIELYLQCVESLETIHNQIELEKTLKNNENLIKSMYNKLYDICENAEFGNSRLNIWFHSYITSGCNSNYYGMPSYYYDQSKWTNNVMKDVYKHYYSKSNRDNHQSHLCNFNSDTIAVLKFKKRIELCDGPIIQSCGSILNLVNDYLYIKSLYFDYQIDSMKKTYNKQIEYTENKYDQKLDTIKEMYDKQIKELQQENQQFKQILIENKLLPEPMPEYNYTDIAKRIRPFKRELIAITKWRKPVPFAVAIPVKTL